MSLGKKNICVSYNMSENFRVGRSIIFFSVLKNAQECLPLTGEIGLENINCLNLLVSVAS